MVPCLAASTADLMVVKLVDRMDTSTVQQSADLKDQMMADKMAALRADSKVNEMADKLAMIMVGKMVDKSADTMAAVRDESLVHY